jgi:hypothetical protein
MAYGKSHLYATQLWNFIEVVNITVLLYLVAHSIRVYDAVKRDQIVVIVAKKHNNRTTRVE